MTKEHKYIWAATLSKVVLLGTMAVVAFATSVWLGLTAVGSFSLYLGFVYLAEKEVLKRDKEAYEKYVSDYAKSIGGGTC